MGHWFAGAPGRQPRRVLCCSGRGGWERPGSPDAASLPACVPHHHARCRGDTAASWRPGLPSLGSRTNPGAGFGGGGGRPPAAAAGRALRCTRHWRPPWAGLHATAHARAGLASGAASRLGCQVLRLRRQRPPGAGRHPDVMCTRPAAWRWSCPATGRIQARRTRHACPFRAVCQRLGGGGSSRQGHRVLGGGGRATALLLGVGRLAGSTGRPRAV